MCDIYKNILIDKRQRRFGQKFAKDTISAIATLSDRDVRLAMSPL